MFYKTLNSIRTSIVNNAKQIKRKKLFHVFVVSSKIVKTFIKTIYTRVIRPLLNKNHSLYGRKPVWKKKRIKNTIKFMAKRIRRRLSSDHARRIVLMRQNMMNLFFKRSVPTILKQEWICAYANIFTIKQRWLFFINRPFFYYNFFFYFRDKNLYKLFNVHKIPEGRYVYKHNMFNANIYSGFISFWSAIKIWSFCLPIFFGSTYLLVLKRATLLPHTMFFWVVLSMLIYWLVSGFVFFIKKYQFSRFTSVIQRFWRRSYILFWLIEGGLLLVFFYLTINASQESNYMFDQGHFLKTHLFSWKLFLFKSICLVSLITYSYLLLLNLKWLVFNKLILWVTAITCLLIYFLWIEFYQIYWVSNFYSNFSWMFDVDESVWSLEWDARRTRIVNHYIMILFLLKFWHIVFIMICWVFFVLRSTESDSITYPMLSFNVQNFIILFLMTWLFMYPWFKQIGNVVLTSVYYWFYLDTHISFFKLFVYDSVHFYYYNFEFFFKTTWQNVVFLLDFTVWPLSDYINGCHEFVKHTIREQIVRQLLN